MQVSYEARRGEEDLTRSGSQASDFKPHGKRSRSLGHANGFGANPARGGRLAHPTFTP